MAIMYAAGTGEARCVAALLAVDGIDVNVQDKVRHSVDNHMRHVSAHCVHARAASWCGHAPSRSCVQRVLAEVSMRCH